MRFPPNSRWTAGQAPAHEATLPASGYIGSDDHYIDMNHSQLATSALYANVDLPGAPEIPIWDKLGGKLVLGALLLGFILYRRDTASEGGFFAFFGGQSGESSP